MDKVRKSVIDELAAVAFADKGDNTVVKCEWLYGIASRIENEYVKLPVDKDGVPIKVGDTVYLGYGDVKYLVTGLSYDITSVSVHVERGLEIGWYSPENVSHEQRPDSLERIAGELDAMGDDPKKCGEDALRDLAERIRKLAKEDE